MNRVYPPRVGELRAHRRTTACANATAPSPPRVTASLARSPATVKPTSTTPPGRTRGRSRRATRGCAAAAPTSGRGDAYRYCKRCHLGAIRRKWTRELVLAAMREWRELYGRLPSSYDWSRTQRPPARRRCAQAAERARVAPGASVVGQLFGSWQEARGCSRRQRTSSHLSRRAARPYSSRARAAAPMLALKAPPTFTPGSSLVASTSL